MLSPPPTVSPNRASGFELLCACSAAHPTPAQAARIATCQFADFDWQEFLSQAEHHGVLALAARNLLNHAPDLPPQIKTSLESDYTTNLRRGLWFASELLRITRHLAQNNVRAIPYKGPVLAHSAYGDLALRNFSDLDLLISPADFERAKKALAEIGYQPSKPHAPAVERLWLKTGYERSFDGPAGQNLVELQWAFLPYFYAVDPAQFEFEDLWSRAGRIALGAGDDSGVPCLSPEDSLLALCLHAAKHLWTRLIWIADIAESSRAPHLDFELIISRARALRIKRILGTSLWLAERLLGTVIPSVAQRLFAGDAEITSLGEICVARLVRAATYDFESTEYFKEVLRLRERRRDRGRFLLRLAWTPGQGDIDAVTLPESIFPLYHGVRLARLAGRFLSSLG